MRYLAFFCLLLAAQISHAGVQTLVIYQPGYCDDGGHWMTERKLLLWPDENPADTYQFVFRLYVRCDGTKRITYQYSGQFIDIPDHYWWNQFRPALLALIPGPCADCPSECDPVNTSLVGLNCCPSPQFGATYTVAQNEDGCDYLACNTANCMTCPPPPSTPEGSTCPCGEGESGTGTITYVYENGCPVGTFCDGCEPCPEVTGDGGDCIYRDVDGSDVPGTYQRETGPDGCPYLVCKGTPPGGCNEDYDGNGIEDVLEGNPYREMDEGADCECENGDAGTVKWENNGFGCLVPSCDCKCEDKDKDDCCDDEDPDPNDKDVNCNSCEFKIPEKIAAIKALFLAKIPATSSTQTSQYEFEFDLGATPIYLFGRPVAFGERFGGDLSDLQMWIGSRDSGGTDEEGNPTRPTNHEVFNWFGERRTEFRNLLSLIAYAFGLRAILFAIFDPSR
ncbi:hypothetical protein [Planctomicrobium sp. SH527]|uniref:hypothetical protein n=1 Tax=Planctomicrobium sp. SH527 TaxID=3448123 RepID=UPI003F5BDEDF